LSRRTAETRRTTGREVEYWPIELLILLDYSLSSRSEIANRDMLAG
jgi:hypothetical protein